MPSRVCAILSGILIIGMICLACADGVSNPVFNAEISDSSGASHHLWGYYLVLHDPAEKKTTIFPVRNAGMHWNVLSWLEQGPCLDCVSVTGITPTPDGTIQFDVEIQHPFSSANLTGFDVRGIAMFHGSEIFPVAALTLSDRTAGDGELVNPDGYTTLYNSSTAGSGPNGLQGYLKGKFASAAMPDASLNGYKRYISPGVANTRNAFYADATLLSTFELDMPDTAFIFGYAIDASWAPPSVKPVTNPMTDFPPEANCSEPWRIDVVDESGGTGLTDQGGEATLTIDVYDRQGSASHFAPVVECPDLFDGIVTAGFVQDFAGYSRWEAVIANENHGAAGEHRCLVKVVDDDDLIAPAWLDITAYQIINLTVRFGGWSRTWGGNYHDQVSGVAVDNTGDIITVGEYVGTVDFDPGQEVDNHTSNGFEDAFISKFDATGNFQWARTWGGDDDDYSDAVGTDSAGNIYVSGVFKETADFDPGPGVDNHTSAGITDSFLVKYDSEGNYLWTATWGGAWNDYAVCVAVDTTNVIFTAGYFQDTADFDPGPDTDLHTSNGNFDVYLSLFDPMGNVKWTITLGGTNSDTAGDVALVHSSGNTYLTGEFMQTVDFDPGPGVVNRTSNGMRDIYTARFDNFGNLVWVKTWGSAESDYSHSLKLAASSGPLYVSGSFSDTCDFDPGGGVDNHTSAALFDAFLSCLNSNGAFQWAVTWGGDGSDLGLDVAVDPMGNPIVVGHFGGTADFDPGPGADNRVSSGAYDSYMSGFDSSGGYNWARTWGGIDDDSARSLSINPVSGDIFVLGDFHETVDMNPGPGIDDHASNGASDAFLTKFLNGGVW